MATCCKSNSTFLIFAVLVVLSFLNIYLWSECRSAKRSARKLERRYKRTVKTSKQSPSARQARETWLQALMASHRLVEQQRRRFWRTEADNSINPSRLWQTIDSVFGRGKENNRTSLTPEDFSAFFTSKVENVR